MKKRLFALALLAPGATLAQTDPLPSWNDGPTKTAILGFVAATTDPASSTFVEPEDRIATFDNDGTLWSEQPIYFQFYFVLDRARELAAADPAWASTPALKAAAAGDVPAIVQGGKAALVELLGATGSGMTVEAFQADAAQWLATAEHAEKHRLYTSMVFTPMIELLEYLRAEDYQTFIVSGGGVHPRLRRGKLRHPAPAGCRLRGRARVPDGRGRARGDARPGHRLRRRRRRQAGRHRPTHRPAPGLRRRQLRGRPRDAAMGHRRRRRAHGHHRPPHRRSPRMAYDRDSHIGKLDKALDMAPAEGWVVIDMAKDWETIWPAE